MKKIVIGSRSSALARVQAEIARSALAEGTGQKFALRWFGSPGDRDLATPIERSAPDFFTRDLDDALRARTISCAVHSAKDLPDPLPDDIDWFWLATAAEDPRDCWVTANGISSLGRSPRIGVSSARRGDYASKVFKRARLLPVRGAIDSRIDQLRRGDFDALLMAMAGLIRLYGGSVPGVTVEPISISDLPPPPGQGVFAVTFPKGDKVMQDVRRHFIKAVRFVSGGVGDPGLMTVRGREDTETADIVLYDDLIGGDVAMASPPLRDGGTPSLHRVGGDVAMASSPLRRQTPMASWIYVGKRAGRHSMDQSSITRLICDSARRGARVVRLKGGDAGLFGRLAEETDALAELGIPFIVRPGVSALTAATTSTGMMLTRRGESRAFEVCTPREGKDSNRRGSGSLSSTRGSGAIAASCGESRNLVMFMATSIFADEAKTLVKAGWPSSTPFAIVRDACGPRETIERGTLADARKMKSGDGPVELPGLVLVGPAAAHAFPETPRVLLTCSATVMPRARLHFEDMGRRVVEWPMIELKARRAYDASTVSQFDYIVFTSPSSVRIFFESYRGDLRALPKFVTCGAGTDAELGRFGFESDVMPSEDFSSHGLIEEIKRACATGDFAGKRVLRLRSALAGPSVARALRRAGAEVVDEILYDNVPVERDCEPPRFDEVFFASASGAKAFLERYGRKSIRGKKVYVMGAPTESALPKGKYARVRW